MESRDPVKRWISRHKVWTGVYRRGCSRSMMIGAVSGTSDTSSHEQRPAATPTTTPATRDSSADSELRHRPTPNSSAPSESSGQENAREQAENYLSYSSFSRKGLIKQLEFEGYSTGDATYAVDAVDVDWYDQAALKAKEYLDQQSFSRSGLQQQLEFEGFTPAQAAHGVSVAY